MILLIGRIVSPAFSFSYKKSFCVLLHTPKNCLLLHPLKRQTNWSIRLTVRTRDSQSLNRSSILLSTTKAAERQLFLFKAVFVLFVNLLTMYCYGKTC